MGYRFSAITGFFISSDIIIPKENILITKKYTAVIYYNIFLEISLVKYEPINATKR